MLVRVFPEQIGDAWDTLRRAVVPSLPRADQVDAVQIANVLFSLMSEKAQLWVYYRTGEDLKRLPIMVLVTTIQRDEVARTANLLIYTAVSLATPTQEEWDDGLETLYSFADSLGLLDVVAYASDEATRLFMSRGGSKISNYVRF